MKKKKQLNNYSIAHKLKDNPAQKSGESKEKREALMILKFGIFTIQCISL